jgi:2-dehydro-3-deoxygluconokinase
MAEPVKYNKIKPAESSRYDAVSMGEVMLRLDPRDIPTARVRDNIRVSQGGGETNVACGLAYTFGLRAAVLTALVDDVIGHNIRNQMRELGVDTSNIIWWNTSSDGSKYSTDKKGTLCNGISFTYNGAGVLPSETTYYRGNSAATKLKPGDFNFDNLFGKQGVRIFNTGGILTLIGPKTGELAIEAAQKAAEYGTFVSADLNYRSKVEPDKNKAKSINKKLAPYIGMLVGNDSDLSDALGYETKAAKKASFQEWAQAYKETVRKVAKDLPNLSLIGTQWRGAHNATFYEAPVRENVPIRDRTGGGDSFASGVLAALLKGKDLETAVNWGAAHGILVQETPGDVTFVDEKAVIAEVNRALKGGGVKAVR